MIPGEPTGHTGLLIKVLPENIVLVGQCTFPNDESCAVLNTIADRIAALAGNSGAPYSVRRVPYPLGGQTRSGKAYASYINSVILNQTVLVPQFGLPSDQAALDVYQEALPGYHIVAIDARSLRSLGGALQCISVTIPAGSPPGAR